MVQATETDRATLGRAQTLNLAALSCRELANNPLSLSLSLSLSLAPHLHSRFVSLSWNSSPLKCNLNLQHARGYVVQYYVHGHLVHNLPLLMPEDLLAEDASGAGNLA